MKDNIRGLLNTRPSCILRVFLLAENVARIVIAPDKRREPKHRDGKILAKDCTSSKGESRDWIQDSLAPKSGLPSFPLPHLYSNNLEAEI